jgi:hypothetical protein
MKTTINLGDDAGHAGGDAQDLQDSAQASMQQALQQGLPPSALAAMPDQGQNTLQRLS